jgi:KaiC domain protein
MKLLSTGVAGMDELLNGGIPENHTVVVLGGMGTGKSTFALQFIMNGLKSGEKAVYISLEEREDEVVETARSFGWDLEQYRQKDHELLRLTRLDPNDVKVTLSRFKNELPRTIKSFGAKRLVIDSITLFEMMFADEPSRRLNLFEMFDLIKETGVTMLVTSEASASGLNASRYGLVEYVSDGAIMFRTVRQDDLREARLVCEVVKMRRVKHSRAIKPYVISGQGIIVHTDSEVF